MPVAVLTIGVPGSGKSTWAFQQEDFCVIERDIIRDELFGIFSSYDAARRYYSSGEFRIKAEEAVNAIMHLFFRIAYEANRDIIISDTNLNIKTVERLYRVLKEIGYNVYYKSFLDTPKERVFFQNMNREKAKVVPENVMKNFLRKAQDNYENKLADIGLKKIAEVNAQT